MTYPKYYTTVEMIKNFIKDSYPFLLICAFILLISGCSIIDNDNNENPGDLLRAWELISITDKEGNAIELFEGEIHTVRYSSEGTLEGETACNFYGGDFSAERDGDIHITNLLSTDIACEQSNHSEEYLNGLAEADEFTLERGRLVLRYGNAGELIFNERLE